MFNEVPGDKSPSKLEDQPEPLLTTTRKAGIMLGVGKTTIYAMLASGKLEGRKVGHATRITTRSIRALAGV